MIPHSPFLWNLARAFLAGSWSRTGLLRRGEQACGQSVADLRRLVAKVLQTFPNKSERPDEADLTTYLWRQLQGAERLQPLRLFWVPPRMQPAPWLPTDVGLPVLTTTDAVANWLGLTLRQLDWFADCPGRTRKRHDGVLHHYTYRRLDKAGGRQRLLEAPRPRLKALQRRILHDILDRLPPHEAALGYRRGKSIIDFVTPHCGKQAVMRFDLREFFPSVRAERVHALFRTVGYPDEVARVLTRLCTNVVPWSVEEAQRGGAIDWQRYRQPHLPQGAPTSPALANLCAFRLDCRLTGLARSVEGHYSRYADDLVLSGGEPLELSARRLHVMVCRLALEEGFEVNTRKTRLLRRGVRQRLVGLVVNVKPNIDRAEYDRLKATLFNCVRFGPAEQNRAGCADFRAHLLGRIAHVERVNGPRGQRLRRLFDRIDWSAG